MNDIECGSFPRLMPGELHLWHVDLDPLSAAIETMAECLSPEERQRAERFVRKTDRRRFIVSHAAVRTIIGMHLGIVPVDVEMVNRMGGKPELTSLPDKLPLRFNLSHSEELALVALTLGREVGVDVEYMRPSVDAGSIVDRYFSPGERATWHALPEHERLASFFRCWTRKEAYLKARGIGLSSGLDRFEVSFAPGEPARLLQCDPTDSCTPWHVYDVSPGGEYLAACVVEGAIEKLSVYDWSKAEC